MSKEAIDFLIQNTGLSEQQIDKVISLFDREYSPQYIYRFCKDDIETLDLASIRNLEKRYKHFKQLQEIKEKFLNELGADIDILPPKVKSYLLTTKDDYVLQNIGETAVLLRDVIKEEPEIYKLADAIFTFKKVDEDREVYLSKYINPDKGLDTTEKVLNRAYNVLVKRIAYDPEVRSLLRQRMMDFGEIASMEKKNAPRNKNTFERFYNFKYDLKELPSHSFFTISRGAKEGYLYFKIAINENSTIRYMIERSGKNRRSEFSPEFNRAFADSYRELLMPSVRNLVMKLTRRKAENLIINDIADKLKTIINVAPIYGEPVLSILPGVKSAARVVVLDKDGNLIEDVGIHPFFSDNRANEARDILFELVQKYKINYAAIAGEQGALEMRAFLEEFKRKKKLSKFNYAVVSRTGSIIYPETEIAAAELPNSDFTIKYLVSIGRKLQNPLMELTKLPLAKIKLHPFQSDINQEKLETELAEVVSDQIADSGVDINRANEFLPRYIPGFNKEIAANIKKHIGAMGAYKNREEIKLIPRITEKAYQEGVGFIFIQESPNLLDQMFIHPNTYPVVRRISEALLLAVPAMIGNKNLQKVDPAQFTTDTTGVHTVKYIINELKDPSNAVKNKLEIRTVVVEPVDPEIIKLGMAFEGIVSNIVDFGIFLDIGLPQKALIHVSELPASSYFDDANDLYYPGQVLKAKVIQMDKDRKRINLSLKGLKQ